MKARSYDHLIKSSAVAIAVLGQQLSLQPARAEERAAPNEQPIALEEIVVTARFREQSAQQVGQSISVVTADQIARQGLSGISDIARATPGLDVLDRGPGRSLPAIRGLSTLQPSQNFDQLQTPNLITQFLDEVSATTMTPNQPDLPLYDLDRVEVLKGPQPTYFGEGSVGGSVRYFLKDPNLTRVEVRSREEISHTDGSGGINYVVDGSVGAPIIADKLGVRLTGVRRSQSGFIDSATTGQNDINDNSATGGTLVVLAKPSDALTVRLSGMYQKATIDFNQVASNPVAKLVQGAAGLPPFPGPNFAHDETVLLTGKISYTAGSVRLESVSGYYDRKFDQLFVDRTQSYFTVPAVFRLPPASSVARNNQRDDNFTQELRIITNFDAPLNLVGGVFYADTRSGIDQVQRDQAFVPVTGGDLYFKANAVINGQQLSTFGELQLGLLSNKRLRLNAGARHFSQDFKTPISGGINLPVGRGRIAFLEFSTLLGSPTATFRNKIEKTLAKGEIEYDVARDVLVYGSISEGARNGLFNSPAIIAVGGLSQAKYSTYGPDSVVAYEVGWKSTLLENRLRLNAAVFDNEWKDIQTLFTVPGGLTITQNGPKARTRGFELEGAVTASRYLSLFTNFGYTEAKFTQTSTLALGGGPAAIRITPDTRIPNVPDWKVNVGIDGRLPGAFSFADLAGGVIFQHVGNSVATVRGQEPLDAYSLVNLRVGLQADNWSVFLFGDNVLNKITTVFMGPAALGENYINRPRTVGLVARLDLR
jgi:outer membrane receptor protein involved in Fe transport